MKLLEADKHNPPMFSEATKKLQDNLKNLFNSQGDKKQDRDNSNDFNNSFSSFNG